MPAVAWVRKVAWVPEALVEVPWVEALVVVVASSVVARVVKVALEVAAWGTEAWEVVALDMRWVVVWVVVMAWEVAAWLAKAALEAVA